MIEPGVGASTCASGSHKCKGIIGTLIPKPKNKKIKSIKCLFEKK